MNTNTPVCRCCRRPETDDRVLEVLRFDVRGISGKVLTGRVITRGSWLCNDCGTLMESF